MSFWKQIEIKYQVSAKLKFKPEIFPKKKKDESNEEYLKRFQPWKKFFKDAVVLRRWLNDMDWKAREEVSQQDRNAILKGISRLVAKTKTRQREGTHDLLLTRTLTNTPEFNEYYEYVYKDKTYNSLSRSSWSISMRKALEEAKIEKEVIVQAWIPLTHIVSIPFMYGKLPTSLVDDIKESSPRKEEYEVIVGPGKFYIEKVDTTYFNQFKES